MTTRPSSNSAHDVRPTVPVVPVRPNGADASWRRALIALALFVGTWLAYRPGTVSQSYNKSDPLLLVPTSMSILYDHDLELSEFIADVDPEFQIAPMIDILLVLLVFFMSISSTEVLQSNQDVNLPVARDAKESKKNPGQVIVNVLFNPLSNQTVIEVDERTVNLGQLAPVLQAKVVANPLVRVLVRADKEVRYEFMRGLLEAVGKAGVGNVTFSVADKQR